MNDSNLDMFLRRAVVAAAQMMNDDAGFDSMVAFHYAVGLSLMGDRTGNGTPIPQITLDGLDALHAAAHILAEETDFDLMSYATVTVADMHVACSVALEMCEWGN